MSDKTQCTVCLQLLKIRLFNILISKETEKIIASEEKVFELILFSECVSNQSQ